MASFTYGVPPFTTTTFTSPSAGTDDMISALVSFDFTINGNGGNDSVATGSGNDTISTGTGNDRINAGDGNNTVTAGDGRNLVTSGTGNDTITTGTGMDSIIAGDGNNTVNAGDGQNVVTSGTGNDTITAGAGADTIDSGGGDDIITTGGGKDVIDAGAGDDGVDAGASDDRITPGGGIDALTGGGGHDTFVYDSLASAALGADTISDFIATPPNTAGEGDLLDLGGLVGDFIGYRQSHGHGHHARRGDDYGNDLAQLVAQGYIDFSGDSSNTVLSFDSNGSAAGGSTGVLVTLVGVAFSTEAGSLITFADNILVG